MKKKAPKAGTRWRFRDVGTTYQLVEPKPEGRHPREGYVLARIVSQTTDEPIGGLVEINVASLGTTYSRVKGKGEK